MTPPDQVERHEGDDIGCLQAIEIFYQYLDGELDEPAAIETFEHHMAHCRSCYSRAEFETMLMKRLRESRSPKAPEAVRRRLDDLMREF